jgi:hypothetical protein
MGVVIYNVTLFYFFLAKKEEEKERKKENCSCPKVSAFASTL